MIDIGLCYNHRKPSGEQREHCWHPIKQEDWEQPTELKVMCCFCGAIVHDTDHGLYLSAINEKQ